ncbi:hypothetical protein [Oceaniglobus roseus]|uniref:hypothetical protein n=1 Tax=Oceaniglobus roseus TaxID=1737570 RepID=UPI000C7EEA72|nr:hypothetical protein [Kandeliimicrobium roseum]
MTPDVGTVLTCVQPEGAFVRFLRSLTDDPCTTPPPLYLLLGCVAIGLVIAVVITVARAAFGRSGPPRSADLPATDLHELAGRRRDRTERGSG